MALDLFFVSKKLDFETVRAPDYEPTVSQLRERRKLLNALIERFPGSRLVGNDSSGVIEGFPRGELSVFPGYFHWCLHGAGEREPLLEVIDWFERKSMLCDDPQDAGFGNRPEAKKSPTEPLDDFDVLIGAQLLAASLFESLSGSLMLRWRLTDGREAEICFVHAQNYFFPKDMREAFDDRVASVAHEPTQIVQENGKPFAMSDDLKFIFRKAGEIYCRHAVLFKFYARSGKS